MQKPEPVIIAPDYTDDELYEWMCQKIKAAQDLKWANEARAKQAENLSALEKDITNLEKAVALSIARMITYPR
ncbi:protein YdfC [Escherichia albertii]|uniref:protein YdfC n=1 Tax=Escherichia albertii TaxID=208962 RepID=UPI000743449E|nr:protein YdfC [Escherichia albertii]